MMTNLLGRRVRVVSIDPNERDAEGTVVAVGWGHETLGLALAIADERGDIGCYPFTLYRMTLLPEGEDVG